jgi:glycosyltransferase involved in cell wall biosynthesis
LHRRLPLQFADLIVAPSSTARDALLGLGVTRPIEVIPNGVDLKRFRPTLSSDDKQPLRTRLGLDPRGQIILFLGSLIERKGPDLLLRAWPDIVRSHPLAQLVFVGPTRDELGQGLKAGESPAITGAMAAGPDIGKRVVFTGRVTNVEDYLRSADLLAFPSRREGMPNAVLESFACGLAAVMTPFLGLSPELGRPGEEYVLVGPAPEALAAGIINLLSDPRQRQELGRRARRWAENHLDLETSLDRYAALYRRLRDSRGAERREGPKPA